MIRKLLTALTTLAVLAAILSIAPSARAQSPDSSDGTDSSAEAVPGEYVVVWRAGAKPTNRSLGQTSNTPTVEVLTAEDLVANRSMSVDTAIDELQDNPMVISVEPNYIYESFAEPNDGRVGAQYALPRVQAFEAWDITEGSRSTVIAIVDTGVDLDHPDLDGKIVPGFDFVNNDDDADDDQSHGTHVAGIAAAETNNGIGIAGMCPNCRIMPVKVLSSAGSGTAADIAAGIMFAADSGADVINMSLGGPIASGAIETAVDYAASRGVFLACAAGNASSSAMQYPAAFSGCLSVASTDRDDNLSGFSTFGTWVDVAAPGSRILSTFVGGGYITFDGTSMASPLVAGIAGLLSSQGLNRTQITNRLCTSADSIDGTGSQFRCGRVNALDAVTNGAAAPLPVDTNANLPLVQVDALDQDRAVGVTSSGQIFHFNGSRWNRISGALVHASFGTDGSIWGVNINDDIWRRTSTSGSWQRVSGPDLVQVDALDYNRAVGVTSAGQIFHFDGSSWNRISGALVHASYGTDGSIWGVNINDEIFRRATVRGGWERVPGGLVQVDALDYDRATGVNSRGRIWHYNRSWSLIRGSLDHASYGADGSVWGKNVNDRSYRRPSVAAGGWQAMTNPR